MPWLDYATQVSELEKIERLSPRARVVRDLPALGEPEHRVACLVCGRPRARRCTACAAVAYCGPEHQEADARWHDAVCDELRAIGEQAVARGELIDQLLQKPADVRAMRGWDDYLDGEPPARARQLTDLATRPLTIASIAAALRIEPRKVHVMAASQRELDVPTELWPCETTLIGPELGKRKGVRTKRALYARALWSELGEPDLIVGFHCGLLMYPSWKPTILGLRGAGVPFVITSYREWEACAEERLLNAVSAQCLIAPQPNPWASRMPKRSSTIANDVSYDNAWISAWA